MPLTRTDFEQIRAIVREELAEALGREASSGTARALDGETEAHRAGRRAVKELIEASAERAARPIADGPFVDRYDASRLLGVSYATIRKWTKQGRVTRRLVRGCIEVSRAEIDAILAARPARKR